MNSEQNRASSSSKSQCASNSTPDFSICEHFRGHFPAIDAGRRVEHFDVEVKSDVVRDRRAAHAAVERIGRRRRECRLELGGHVVDVRLALIVEDDHRRVREAKETVRSEGEENAVRSGRLRKQDLSGFEGQATGRGSRRVEVHGARRVLDGLRDTGRQRER